MAISGHGAHPTGGKEIGELALPSVVTTESQIDIGSDADSSTAAQKIIEGNWWTAGGSNP